MLVHKKSRISLGQQAGVALPIAIALGMAMLAIASASLLLAQGDRNTAVQRQSSGASFLVSDSALARALLQLSKPNNSMLLVRNYDPIDPTTGKNYLGADGIPKSGDETGGAIDQWTGYDPSGSPCAQQIGRTAPSVALTGTIGANATYTIRAYRYDKQKQLGTLLAEGRYQGQAALVAVTLTIEPIWDDFPGIFLNNRSESSADGKLALRNRSILGENGNIYYSPIGSADSSLTGMSAPGDSTRSSYLNAIWSGPSDGASGDSVAGKLFACRLTPSVPVNPQGTNLLDISESLTLEGSASGITHYRIQTINLSGNETLTVNTTAGPVYLYLTGGTSTLRDTAKILNIRKDGQSPQVGDLRIMSLDNDGLRLFDRSCIQDAFIYFPKDQLELYTTGPGCLGGQNTNFEGVAWVEELLFSKNASSNRDVALSWQTIQNTTVIPAVTSGIDVPGDVSSLADLLEYLDWPARYRYKTIQSWQRVN
ncbi:hypothetical protein [Altericista sp. CCNU0014]|uniref:hypothetical protein n=1 Tax=Altericista sp. CCNU0014 TaxID=3082949 RepID=UPI00384AFFC5